jgi:hypothetical protein
MAAPSTPSPGRKKPRTKAEESVFAAELKLHVVHDRAEMNAARRTRAPSRGLVSGDERSRGAEGHGRFAQARRARRTGPAAA